MQTKQAMAARHSVRAYQDKQLPEESLNAILWAGSAGPVGMKRYDTLHYTVIQDQPLLHRLSQAIQQSLQIENDPLYGAPCFILVSSQPPSAPGIDYVNAACMVENMMLLAADEGIGSVIVWAVALVIEADPSLKAALGLPKGFHAVVGAAFGYEDGAAPAPKSQDLSVQVNRV